MGKMKELSMNMEQDEQKDSEFDEVMEEMHYIHVIDSFVSLIQVYGWSKVMGDFWSKLVKVERKC